MPELKSLVFLEECVYATDDGAEITDHAFVMVDEDFLTIRASSLDVSIVIPTEFIPAALALTTKQVIPKRLEMIRDLCDSDQKDAIREINKLLLEIEDLPPY